MQSQKYMTYLRQLKKPYYCTSFQLHSTPQIHRHNLYSSPPASTMPPKLLLILCRRLSTQPILRRMSTAPSPPPITTRILEAPHCGHIKILSLNRPQARNAISRQLLQDLHHEIEILHSEPAN